MAFNHETHEKHENQDDDFPALFIGAQQVNPVKFTDPTKAVT